MVPVAEEMLDDFLQEALQLDITIPVLALLPTLEFIGIGVLMNAAVFLYVGFALSILLLAWGALVILRRTQRRKVRNTDARVMHRWITLNDTRPTSDETDAEDEAVHQPSKAQQNGHYSESKRKY